jgi:hypothetical protein
MPNEKSPCRTSCSGFSEPGAGLVEAKTAGVTELIPSLHRGGKSCSHGFARRSNWIGREMGIALSRCGVFVT